MVSPLLRPAWDGELQNSAPDRRRRLPPGGGGPRRRVGGPARGVADSVAVGEGEEQRGDSGEASRSSFGWWWSGGLVEEGKAPNGRRLGVVSAHGPTCL
jgi:hypothetical protein